MVGFWFPRGVVVVGITTMTRQHAEQQTILRATVGSTVHGINIQDGIEDRDEMGICIESMDEAMGIGAPFEQYVYRSAHERTGKQDEPSQAGDLDLTIYSLRKYIRLALKGNPTVLTLLFVPNDQLIIADARGMGLRELTPYIVSRKAGGAFLGYLHAQRQRLLGERGNGGHGQPRRGLVEAFGYDTKYASHMLRLGLQGIELMKTGQFTLPMPEMEREYIRAVRRGEKALDAVLTDAGRFEDELKDLRETSPLPEEPTIEPVEDWMLRTYFYSWSARRAHDFPPLD